MSADAITRAGLIEDIATKIIRNVCEIPGRTSPEDEPSALICSAEELETCIARVLEDHPALISPAGAPGKETLTLQMLCIHLPGGRMVGMARRGAHGAFLKFVNENGLETPLALSGEAMQAVRQLSCELFGEVA